MHLHQALLAVVVYFVACANDNALSAATGNAKATTWALPADPLPIYSNIAGRDGVRSLRVENENSEQRNSLWSKISNSVKVRWWLERKKSDSYVVEALKLKNLKGDDLLKAPNYKYLKFFREKSEEYLLNKWLKKEFTTYQVWMEKGLKDITDPKDLAKIKKTDNFRVYKRYVNDFDTYVLRTMKAGYIPPRMMVSFGTSNAEMVARTEIMAESGRSAAYAKLALGMSPPGKPATVLYGNALETNPAFPYFQFFLRVKEPALRRELTRLDEKLKRLKKLSRSDDKARTKTMEELELFEKYVQGKNIGV
ncbi:unnamed protein product [Phytophthora fragariaefolia]|uniref:Unnamed protein product n=1 Tax=Phytophthora fragariaefolia TaxID=1490495 RepID=A0A9W7D699_9STRA|nr:unnamed protein product [Phytophthora fragariaefolia]